jgi:hypothetical protein
LLYYDVFKRSNPLTKIQLDGFLKKIGVSVDSIKNLENTSEKHMEDVNRFYSSILDTEIYIIGNINGVEIIKYIEKMDTASASKNNIKYYVVVPGFTINEFVSYIEKLRKYRDPRPFLNSPPLIPHTHNTRYTKDEIMESICLFHKSGLIRLITPVYPDETRYKITDEMLYKLISLIRQIHLIQYHMIIAKIFNIEKPNSGDIIFLNCFFGERMSNLIIAKANESRKTIKNNPNDEKINKNLKIIQECGDNIEILIQIIRENYSKVLEANELVQDLIV